MSEELLVKRNVCFPARQNIDVSNLAEITLIQASRTDTSWKASDTECTLKKANVKIKTVSAYEQMCRHEVTQSVIQQMLGCVKIIFRLLVAFI